VCRCVPFRGGSRVASSLAARLVLCSPLQPSIPRRCWPSHRSSVPCGRRPTLSSSGRSKACFAGFSPPLMSNVRPREPQGTRAPTKSVTSSATARRQQHTARRRHMECARPELRGSPRRRASSSVAGSGSWPPRALASLGRAEGSRRHCRAAPLSACEGKPVQHPRRSRCLQRLVRSPCRMPCTPASSSPWPNPSFEATSSGRLRLPPAAPQLKR
jgi:hypothetical protein